MTADPKPTQSDLERDLSCDLRWCDLHALDMPWADLPRHPERKAAWSAAIRRAIAAEAEVERLRALVGSLAARVAGQSELLADRAETPAPAGEPVRLTAETVAVALSLVLTTGPGWDEFDWDGVEAMAGAWTEAQRREAFEWAWTEHLHAADNPVELLPRPAFLPEGWS